MKKFNLKDGKITKNELLNKWNSLSKKRKQLIIAGMVAGSLAGLCCIALMPNGNASRHGDVARVEEKENSKKDILHDKKEEDKKLPDTDTKDSVQEQPHIDNEKKEDTSSNSNKDVKEEDKKQTNENNNVTPSPEKPKEPSNPVHNHEWKEVTKTIHHDAVTHVEKILVEEAWDEPVFETVYKDICNDCGADVTGNANGHLLATEHGSFTGGVPFTTQTGVNHHGAVYNDKTILDQEAYDEVIVTGFICSCGATK